MNNDRIEITDELIACYLEGNVTDEERAAVEAYLSENDEAMGELMMNEARSQGAGVIITSIGHHMDLPYDKVFKL